MIFEGFNSSYTGSHDPCSCCRTHLFNAKPFFWNFRERNGLWGVWSLNQVKSWQRNRLYRDRRFSKTKPLAHIFFFFQVFIYGVCPDACFCKSRSWSCFLLPEAQSSRETTVLETFLCFLTTYWEEDKNVRRISICDFGNKVRLGTQRSAH